MCKAVGCVQCTAVFLSSSSIVLIAADRYRYILHPQVIQRASYDGVTLPCFQSRQMSIRAVVCLTTMSLLASLALSSPLLVVTKLEIRKNLFSDKETSFCYEVYLLNEGFTQRK